MRQKYEKWVAFPLELSTDKPENFGVPPIVHGTNEKISFLHTLLKCWSLYFEKLGIKLNKLSSMGHV